MSNEKSLTTVQPKSMVVAMLLAFFLNAGGFYAAGAKKGAMLFFGCWIASLLLQQISVYLMPIVSIASLYLTYLWVKEYNSGIAAAA